jgi:hypothetical protein
MISMAPGRVNKAKMATPRDLGGCKTADLSREIVDVKENPAKL